MNIPPNSPLGRQCLKLAGEPDPAAPGRPVGGEPLATGVLLAVKAAGFLDPQPEWPVTPDRGWRLDWAWPELKVAFERHGGQWVTTRCPGCGRERREFKSRHHDRDGLEADLEKMNAAQNLGWVVIAATPGMIRSGLAGLQLVDALESRRAGR